MVKTHFYRTLLSWKHSLNIVNFSPQAWRRRKLWTTITTVLLTTVIILQLLRNSVNDEAVIHVKKGYVQGQVHNKVSTTHSLEYVRPPPKANLSHPVFSNFTKLELELFENSWNLQLPWRERTIAQVALIDIVQRHRVLKEKVIYVMNNKQPEGRYRWMEENCPDAPCRFTHKYKDEKLDAVIFDNDYYYPSIMEKQPGQTWIYIRLENPLNPQPPSEISKSIDWMVTYWTDSLIVSTYNNRVERYPRFKGMRISNFTSYANKDFSAGKTKKVVWFASNCYAQNDRLEYAKELGKHIEVDIYGGCGTLDCPRSKEAECFEKIKKDYKFYLAFENANCDDYITEKFWRALKYDAIPIVMGAMKENYLNQVPRDSFIYVDDYRSPRELAAELHKLDKDPVLYNKYFEWRKTPGENLEFQQFCRICAMLHGLDWLKTENRVNQADSLQNDYFGAKACVPSWTQRKIFGKDNDNDDYKVDMPDIGEVSDRKQEKKLDLQEYFDNREKAAFKPRMTTLRPFHKRNRNYPRND